VFELLPEINFFEESTNVNLNGYYKLRAVAK
jgi:hypothetical protein